MQWKDLFGKRDTSGKSEKTSKKSTAKSNKKTPPGTGQEENKAIETKVEDSKYYSGPMIQKFEGEREFQLPHGYSDNKIVLLVRDPYWLYSYWEISNKRIEEIKQEHGDKVLSESKECLRVYNVDNWDSFDIEISGGARNWYINVPYANTSYCADIGIKTLDGRFIAAARSNTVTTPLDHMSDVIDEEWMIPDWNKMYLLSGGFGIGKGSEEIRELMKKRLQEESSSGWVSSMSSPVKQIMERPFWLWAEAELIVYGATEPNANLTIQKRKVDLKPDGTFSLRYALPQGKQMFDLEAVKKDGSDKKKIAIKVERDTEK